MGFEVIRKAYHGRTLVVGVSMASICHANGSNYARISLGNDVLGKMNWEKGTQIEVARDGKKLRLKRNDLSGFRLVQSSQGRAAYLSLTGLACSKSMPRKPTPHLISNGALYITLPDWAVKTAP